MDVEKLFGVYGGVIFKLKDDHDTIAKCQAISFGQIHQFKTISEPRHCELVTHAADGAQPHQVEILDAELRNTANNLCQTYVRLQTLVHTNTVMGCEVCSFKCDLWNAKCRLVFHWDVMFLDNVAAVSHKARTYTYIYHHISIYRHIYII